MWVKTENLSNSRFQASMNSFNKSWEEQAFAKDAPGPLEGFVWPPRSYPCSFCKREFRSAQALGGHMNIHRRDRAKLKQSLRPPCSDHHVHRHHNHPCDQPSDAPYSYQLCTADSNIPDPNSNPSFAASPHLPSAVQEIFSTEHTYMSPFASSIVKEHQEDFLNASPPSLSDWKGSVRGFSTSGSKTTFLSHDDDDHIETNLSVGLTLVVSKNPPIGSAEGEEAGGCKTHKAALSSLPFFLKPCSEDAYSFQSEVFGLKSSSMEDIDLELRLGAPPKVK